jgi:hypothetical protein
MKYPNIARLLRLVGVWVVIWTSLYAALYWVGGLRLALVGWGFTFLGSAAWFALAYRQHVIHHRRYPRAP